MSLSKASGSGNQTIKPIAGSSLVSTCEKFTHWPTSARKLARNLLSSFEPEIQSTLENAKKWGADNTPHKILPQLHTLHYLTCLSMPKSQFLDIFKLDILHQLH